MMKNRSELKAMYHGCTYGADVVLHLHKAEVLFQDTIRLWLNEKLADPALTTIHGLQTVRKELNEAIRELKMLEHVIEHHE